MRMKFRNKEYQQSKIQSTPHSPKTEIKCRPRLFSLTVFYRSLKHEQVTDFSGPDRLLRSSLINEF